MPRLHNRLGWLGISVLMLPILYWVWLPAQDPVRSVFSGAVPLWVLRGKLFTEQFDTAHAGSAMDQPTIGKWLFWFTVMTASSLPYAAAVRWLADRRETSARVTFSVWVLALCVCLACILAWPALWLIQYVSSMGITSKRAFGLLYAMAGACLLAGFLWWASKKPPDTRAGQNLCRNCSYDLTGNLSGVCPECGLSLCGLRERGAGEEKRRELVIGIVDRQCEGTG